MKVYRLSDRQFSVAPSGRRVRKLKWWFVLLIIIGTLAIFALGFFMGFKVVDQIKTIGSFMSPIPYAHAQSEPMDNEFNLKVIIIVGIFIVLVVVYFAAIYSLLFSRTPKQIDRAAELVKTLTGFFVGAATGFIG